MRKKQYWLMKSEPEVYSFSLLKKEKTTWWTGVRNYQARNFMMNDMQVGDLVFFYHSNAEPTGIAGLAEVSRASEADPTQFDAKSELFDPKSSKENPRWKCVQVKFYQDLARFLTLEELRENKKLEGMMLLRKGQRLSVQPVTENEFKTILSLAEANLKKVSRK